MSRPLSLRLSLLLLTGLGCAGAGEGVAPAGESATGDAAGLVSAPVANFEVTVDLKSLGASVRRLPHSRQSQQSELFSLSLEQLQTPTTFLIRDVRVSGNELAIEYHVTHPFPPPSDLTGTPSALNRADLAIVGRVLWLLDAPDAETYFASDAPVRLNSRAVLNPDGFFEPRTLISDPGLESTAFPYQLIVDEARDNRLALSNGGAPTGNYGPGGWELQDYIDGLTGFGLLAQGQTAANTIRFDLAELAGPSFSVRVALIAKYEDPRGGTTIQEKRGNRLPSGNLVYRMPHAALDVEQLGAIAIDANTLREGEASSAQVSVRVRDWDATAAESTGVNLASEPDPSRVSLGESGAPVVTLDIPKVAGAEGTTLALQAGPETGVAGDELRYAGALTGIPEEAGTLRGLIRGRDITDVTAPTGWDALRFNLLPDLTPIPGETREGDGYLPLRIEVEPAPPAGEGWVYAKGSTVADVARGVAVDSANHVYLTGVFYGDTDFGEGTVPGSRDAFVVKLDATGTPIWIKTFLSAEWIEGHDVVVDDNGDLYVLGAFRGEADFGDEPVTSRGSWDIYLQKYDPEGVWLDGDRFGEITNEVPRGIAIGPDGGLVITGEFNGTGNFGGANVTAVGEFDVFVAKYDAGIGHVWDFKLGDSGWDIGHDVAVDTLNRVVVTGEFEERIFFGADEITSLGLEDAFLARYTSAPALDDYVVYAANPAEFGYGVAVDSADAIYVGGQFFFGVDFGFGTWDGEAGSGFLVKLDSAFAPQWGWMFEGDFVDQVRDVVVTADDSVLVCGNYSANADLGSGPRTAVNFGGDLFAAEFAGDGTPLWDYTAGSPGEDLALAIAAPLSGGAALAGEFESIVDFEPGNGQTNRLSLGGTDLFAVRVLEGGVW